MNNELPEINFKEKKEKKGGALGWLKGRFGAGSGGSMGQAGITPSAMNVGRALGTAKFGASSGGFAALLAGKASTIAAIAMFAVASGVYMAKNAPEPATSTGAFTSAKTDNYVPAIQRSQAANSGSSLDMFKDTNKGAGLAMEGDPSAVKKPEAAKPAAAEAAAEPDPNQAAPGQGDAAQDMMAKLQGGSGSMTSSLGGGSSKFSAMGGFGNKFGQGATGAKGGFTSGIGSGFSGMPKFDQRKGKLLAMKGSARPVFSGSKGGKGKFGNGAFGQAKGLRNMQKTYSGTSADSARSTQDAAWTGSTAEGNTGAGGAGLSDGGAGIVTSPSLDNTSGSGGGGGTDGSPTGGDPLPVVPTNASPWAGLVNSLVSMLTMAAILAALGSALIKVANAMSTAVFAGVAAQAIRIAGYAMCIAAMVLGAVIIVQAMTLISQHGQAMLGSLFMIGGACAIAAGGMGMAGAFGMVAMFNPMWMSAAAGVIGLAGGMMGGK